MENWTKFHPDENSKIMLNCALNCRPNYDKIMTCSLPISLIIQHQMS